MKLYCLATRDTLESKRKESYKTHKKIFGKVFGIEYERHPEKNQEWGTLEEWLATDQIDILKYGLRVRRFFKWNDTHQKYYAGQDDIQLKQEEDRSRKEMLKQLDDIDRMEEFIKAYVDKYEPIFHNSVLIDYAFSKLFPDMEYTDSISLYPDISEYEDKTSFAKDYLLQIDTEGLAPDKLWIFPFRQDFFYIEDHYLDGLPFFDPDYDDSRISYIKGLGLSDDEAVPYAKNKAMEFWRQKLNINEFEQQKKMLAKDHRTIMFLYFDDIPASALKVVDQTRQ